MKINPNTQIQATAPQFVKTTLTSAQIKALRATPIQIAPAPGAGKAILPYLAIIVYHGQGATAYDVSGGGNMGILWGTVDPFSLLFDSGVLTETVDEVNIPTTGYDTSVVAADIVNKAIMLKNLGGAEYITGTGDAIVTFYYNIVDID